MAAVQLARVGRGAAGLAGRHPSDQVLSVVPDVRADHLHQVRAAPGGLRRDAQSVILEAAARALDGLPQSDLGLRRAQVADLVPAAPLPCG